MIDKPAAYIRKTSNGTYISLTPIGDNYGAKTDKTIPLYTLEQLHPRVKMTQSEFESFQVLFEAHDDLFTAFHYIGNYDCYEVLYDRLFTGTDTDREKQNEFAALWASFNIETPEETIEIVPEMKWFVVSKSLDDGICYVVGEIDNYYPTFNSALNETEVAKCGYPFDTEEEAKQWTNPLTKAVHLPVEDANYDSSKS